MTPIERWHPPLGRNFTPEAEAVADLALRTPVVKPEAIGFKPDEANKAHISLNGWQIDGFAKGSIPVELACQMFVANLATMLNLPSSPYVTLLQNNHQYISSCRGSHKGAFLFSAPAFKSYTTGWGHMPPHSIVKHADPVSLGAASQFRLWISDEDDWAPNTARETGTGAIALFDHDAVIPHPFNRYAFSENRDMLLRSYSSCKLDGNKECYTDSATQAAERIRHLDYASYRAIAEPIQQAGLPLQRGFIKKLWQRRLIFTRPRGMPKHQPNALPSPRPA